MNLDKIIIKGAKEHNLKNINVEIPKNKLASIFMEGGYRSKDGQEASKPAQSKINRYAIIFASKKIQTLVKNAKSPSDVSKIFIDNKLTSQGKLLTFAGQKPKTALEILKNGFRISVIPKTLKLKVRL